MDAMRETIQEIVSSPVPVATYVAPSGGTRGFRGLLPSRIRAMWRPWRRAPIPARRIPVPMAGEMDAIMKEKVENDAAAYMRSISTKRGRNSALAETAVRESKSFTEKEALDNNLIDLVAADTTAPAGGARRPHGHAVRRPHADLAHCAAP